MIFVEHIVEMFLQQVDRTPQLFLSIFRIRFSEIVEEEIQLSPPETLCIISDCYFSFLAIFHAATMETEEVGHRVAEHGRCHKTTSAGLYCGPPSLHLFRGVVRAVIA